MLKSGVVKVMTPMMPNGSAVQISHGRNLPHLVTVRSAITPMIGLMKATAMPMTRNIIAAWLGGSP
jgi:hypothetical protein